MKKLIFSLALLALPAFGDVPAPKNLLERISVEINSPAPRAWNWVRVNDAGVLEVKVCRAALLPTYPSTKTLVCETRKPAVLEGTTMERLKGLMVDATKGEMKFSPKAGEPSCAAVPAENVTYRSSVDARVLWTGATPCGTAYYNDSPAAAELKQWLDSALANE